MARSATGHEHVEAARALLKTARSASELRLAQAVLLPLEFGLSLEQTAACIGRSVGATCSMRTRFIREVESLHPAQPQTSSSPNHAHAELDKEAAVLNEVFSRANGLVSIPGIKAEIEASLGKPLTLSSIYRMLARHGWQKLPEPRPPLDGTGRREVWKKRA